MCACVSPLSPHPPLRIPSALPPVAVTGAGHGGGGSGRLIDAGGSSAAAAAPAGFASPTDSHISVANKAGIN